MRPPDLQHLVQRFGGYDKITPDAWAEYDAAVKQWHADRRAEILDDQYRSRISPRPRTRPKAGRTTG